MIKMEEKKEESFKRETAKNQYITDIISSKHIKKNNEPNYFENNYGKYSRVNIIGVVISKEPNSFFLDDSTGKIGLRFFDNFNLNDFEVGDNLNIIGKPREFNNEFYIIPEIIKKINSTDFIEFRKLILNKRKPLKKVKKNIETTNSENKEEIIIENPDKIEIINYEDENKNEKKSDNKKEETSLDFSKIIDTITKLDDGGGVFIENILSEINHLDCEKKIKILLEKGDIFEIRPGKVKVL